MNRIFLFLTILLLSISCKTEEKFENPNWLIGKWERVNKADSTKTTHEIWNSNLLGVSITIKDNDTIFKENISIINSNGKKYFQITGLDGKPTFFEFTSETKNSFTCENPRNYFPKKITYSLKEDLLESQIENNDFTLDFIYKSIQ